MEPGLYVVIIAFLCLLPEMPGIIRPVGSEDKIFLFSEDYSQEGSGYEDSYSDILEPPKKPATIFDSVQIASSINWRYASTSTVATYTNTADHPQEVNFSVKVNKDSFISSFTMIVDDVVYDSHVKHDYGTRNDAETETQWQTSQFQGSRDGLFSIQLRLAEGSKVVLNLTCQEIVQRINKVYRHAVHLSPNLITDNMKLEVLIDEPEGIESVDASWVHTTERNQKNIEIFLEPGSKKAYVVYNPPVVDFFNEGIKGHLEVTYALVLQTGGAIQVQGGYFVHFFSFEGLGLVPKHIMFVLDISGSMTGRNLQQTKLAASYMLQQLHTFDHFNIMTFSNDVYKWRPNFVPASSKYVSAGIRFIKRLNAHGGTNIKEALLTATKAFSSAVEAYLSIIFLTDGVPTVGGTKSSRIVRAVNNAIDNRIALFCIGIGDDVDSVMLKHLGDSNHGRYCNVETGRKAGAQMKTFYDEISNPVLFDVRMSYDSRTVNNDSLPLTDFPGYLDGQEIIVPGMLRENIQGKHLNVTVEGDTGKKRFQNFRSESIENEVGHAGYKLGNLIERLWALSKIKDLNLRTRTARSTSDKISSSHQLMLLAQKYGFVTPMTRLVVSNQNSTGVKMETLQPFEFLGLQVPLSQGGTPLRSDPSVPALFQQERPDSVGGRKAPISRVFGDPHFAIDIWRSNFTICFDVQKKQGTVLRLLSDSGLIVNAEIQMATGNTLTSGVTRERQGRSMFGRFGISLGVHKILVLEDKMIIDDEISLQWDIFHSMCLEEYNLTNNRENLTITNNDGLRMRIHRHFRIKHPTYFDFVLEDGRCLSPLAHGLIGQFQYKYFRLDEIKIQPVQVGHMERVMIYNDREFLVRKGKIKSTESSECWHGPTEEFIDGDIDEYVTGGIFG